MQAAFDEFRAHMMDLEGRATGLVKESLREIDKEKIADALEKIKKISKS